MNRLLSLLAGGIVLAIAADATITCPEVTSQNITGLKTSTGGMQGVSLAPDRLANMIAVRNGNPVTSGTFASAATLSVFDSVSLSPASVAMLNSFSQVFNGAGSAVIPIGSNGGGSGGSSQGGSSGGITTVPEPVTMILMGSGLIALGLMRRKAHLG